jgi:hypothetical protein
MNKRSQLCSQPENNKYFCLRNWQHLLDVQHQPVDAPERREAAEDRLRHREPPDEGTRRGDTL